MTKLAVNQQAPDLKLSDVDGQTVPLTESGKITLLAFFRDAACPFCNLRIYQMTQNYEQLNRLGLRMVAVFPGNKQEIKQYVVRNGRPFPVIAQVEGDAHEMYAVGHSLWGKIRAILFRWPTLIKANRLLGMPHRMNTNNRMPADFLIDDEGKVLRAYYGKDIGDRMPFAMIEEVLAKNVIRRAYEGKPLPQA